MKLSNPQAFFDAVRAGLLGPVLSQSEVAGCNALLSATEPWPMAWTAYGLGTAYHETAHSMQPVKEIGGDDYFRRRYDPQGNHPDVAAQLGNNKPGDGVKFAGRGYIQLTGRANYERADRVLGLHGSLANNPDTALEPHWAALILVHGMNEGWFTGRRLVTTLPSDRAATRGEFINARRIVNGQDRADLIAGYALEFQTALEAAA